MLWVKPASVVQLDAHPTGDQEVASRLRVRSPPGRQHSFMESDQFLVKKKSAHCGKLLRGLSRPVKV